MGKAISDWDEWKQFLKKKQRIACDSMLFSYHFYANPQYSPLTTILFELLETHAIEITTSVVSYLEILSYPQLTGDEQARIKEFFHTQPALFIVPLTIDIAEKGSDIRRITRLKTIDAIQLTTAEESHATVFLTNDNDFRVKKLQKHNTVPIVFLTDWIS